MEESRGPGDPKLAKLGSKVCKTWIQSLQNLDSKVFEGFQDQDDVFIGFLVYSDIGQKILSA